MTPIEKDPLTGSVIGCAIEGHKVPGSGLRESAYEQCLDETLKNTSEFSVALW